MMQSCGTRGMGGAKLVWRHCNTHVVASRSSSVRWLCVVARGGSFRRQGAVVFRVYGSVASVGIFGREYGRVRLSGLSPTVRRISRNSVALNDSEIGSLQRKGIAIEVNGCVLEPTGLGNEGSDSLDPQKEREGDVGTSVGSVLPNIQEEVQNGFHGFEGADSPSVVEAGAEDFLSRELVLNSQAILSNRPVSRRKMETEDDREPLTVWPQLPGEPERWWRIPDFVHEVLTLPKNFDLQLEILYDKLGCRIHSRELLLRILVPSIPVSLSCEFEFMFWCLLPLARTNGVLMICLGFVFSMGQVHKSYYLLKMPQSIKERKLRKPLMSWQRSETIGDDDLMTFAEAHGEARLQLALLGDTVLNLAASLYLIRQHPLLSTGLITERRSQMVCNSNLARAWSTLLDLRELVLCDPPLSQSKKPSATTILELQMKACADTLEAYIGGLYVEKGLESALQYVETRLLPLLLLAEPIRNPVALLHERCVIVLQEKPDYKLIGIDNKNTPNEMCRIRVYVKGFRMSTGIGKSQKLARRDAAEKALLKWPEVFGSIS